MSSWSVLVQNGKLLSCSPTDGVAAPAERGDAAQGGLHRSPARRPPLRHALLPRRGQGVSSGCGLAVCWQIVPVVSEGK